MKSNIYVIDNGASFLLLDLNSLCHCEIDKREFTKAAAEKAVAEHFTDSRPYFERLKPKENTEERITPVIVTSFACNYTCEYCYQSPSKAMQGRMTPQGIDAIYHFYQVFCQSHAYRLAFDRISVIGGEPLLPENRETIERVLEVWPGKPLIITTNGSYLPDYADILAANQAELVVSLDGTEKIHYARRKTNDPHAYEKAIEGIRLLLASNVKINVSALFFPDHLEQYSDFFDLMETLGWLRNPNLTLSFGPELGCGNDDQTHENVMRNLRAFTALRKRDSRAGFVYARRLLPGCNSLMEALELADAGEYMPYRCGLFTNPSFAFLPNGTVTPCLGIQDERFRIGRFLPKPEFNEEYYAALAQRRIDRMEKCRDCPQRVLCRGGCLATVLHKRKNYQETVCDLWQDLEFLDFFETAITQEPQPKATD